MLGFLAFRSLEEILLKAFTGLKQGVISYDRLGCHQL